MAVILASKASVGLNKGKPVQTNTSNVAQPAIWTRPADWVSFTTPSSNEQKVIGIVAVYDVDSNYIALACTVTGGYTVDWGDGTSTTHASGVTAQKNYVFGDLSAGTLSSRGYRQAVITVTPTTGGATFSAVNLNRRHSGITNASTEASNPWLDIAVAAPNATTIEFSRNSVSTVTSVMSLCEQVTIVSHNTTTMAYKFYGCDALQSVPLFNTSSVTTMAQMFYNCRLLQSVPRFDTSSVTDMSQMFFGCNALQSVPLFNTSSVTTMANMFGGCERLKSVPLFDTSSVTNMTNMFNACASLESVPLFDTSSVTTMFGMFNDCTSLRSVPLFDTSSVTTMSQMFYIASALQSVPLFDTSSVTNMSTMFRDCFALQSVPLFDTSSVTTMAQMFSGCESLQSVPLFDTSSVTDMSTMFNSCSSLESVPLFDTSSVTNMTNMFTTCRLLKSVPLFDTSSVTTMSAMFGSSADSLRFIPELNLTKISAAANQNLGLGNVNATSATSNLARAKLTGMRWSLSFQNCNMGATQLNEMYTALATLNPNVTNVTASAGVVTYTVDDIRAFVAARTVTITGVNPVAYNLTNATVGTVTAGAGNTGTFTVTNAATGTYVSGGVAALQDNRTITVTGNPGVAGDDPTIAQNKGWTVTG